MMPVVVLAALFLGAPPAAPGPEAEAAPDDLFAACLKVKGKTYEEARGRLIRDWPGDDYLRFREGTGGWEERCVAQAARAWHDDPDGCKKLSDAPLARDRTGRAHYSWAVRGDLVPASLIPVLYEILTGKVGPDGGPGDAAEALARLSQKGQPLDVKLLTQFLRDEAVKDAGARRAATAVIASLSEADLSGAYPADLLRYEAGRQDPDRDVTALLLSGACREKRRARDDDRDRFVEGLAGDARLKDLIGPTQIAQGAADVGGPAAAVVVASYLRDPAREPNEHIWALDALAANGTAPAREAVAGFAQSLGISMDERRAAETSLAWLERGRPDNAVPILLAQTIEAGRLEAGAVAARRYRAAQDERLADLEADLGKRFESLATEIGDLKANVRMASGDEVARDVELRSSGYDFVRVLNLGLAMVALIVSTRVSSAVSKMKAEMSSKAAAGAVAPPEPTAAGEGSQEPGLAPPQSLPAPEPTPSRPERVPALSGWAVAAAAGGPVGGAIGAAVGGAAGAAVGGAAGAAVGGAIGAVVGGAIGAVVLVAASGAAVGGAAHPESATAAEDSREPVTAPSPPPAAPEPPTSTHPGGRAKSEGPGTAGGASG
jgi:hypothetical protein